MKKISSQQVIVFLYLLCLGVALLPAPAQSEVAKPVKLMLRASGGPTGTGKDIAVQFPSEAMRRANPGWTVDVVNGPTTIAEIAMMGRGEIQFTRLEIGEIPRTRTGFYGTQKLPQPVELRWLAPSSMMSATLYLNDKVPINSIPELIQKKYPLKVSMGRKGSGPYNMAVTVLDAYGIAPDDFQKWGGKVQYQETRRGSELLGDGLIDGMLVLAEIPTNAITELERTRKLKAIFVTEPNIHAELEKKGYMDMEIPAGIYGFVKTRTVTVGMPGALVCPANLNEDVAYHMVKAMWEQREFLHKVHIVFRMFLTQDVIKSWGAKYKDTLHPGALKYWKEQGFIK